MIFYAGINLGFGSGYKSQVNEAMLQVACFDLLGNLRSFNLNDNYPLDFNQPNSVQLPQSDLLLLSSPIVPDSPDVKIPDSVFVPPDTTDLIKVLDSSKVLKKDSLKVKTKVKINQDSVRIAQMALDSTARLEYFRYQREDVPYTKLDQKKKSKFFVEPSPSFKTRTVTIDSTGKYVEIKEMIAGKPNKIVLKMPLEEYIATRLQIEERKKWELLGYTYELKNTKLGLGDLIKNFTDFEIPLPSVGVLSIFGPPKISLKIGGSVQIHGAWRTETTEGVTASRLGNTKNEPDFKQQVQINVNGTIGDKLNIAADWNTERTFEYENQLKIKYTGYEDEIIQSIEAGNVSLQTSPLVGGSEALFGIKAQFKMGRFSLTTIATQQKGETKEMQVSGGTSESPFLKRAFEYSTNHYFLDTIYASKTSKIFSTFYENAADVTVDGGKYDVSEIQVWKSAPPSSINKSNERNASVYINLEGLPRNTSYDDSLRTIEETKLKQGVNASGRFILLTDKVDYILHKETGFITLKTSVNDNEMIAIAYRIENGPGTDDDTFYGEFIDAKDTNSVNFTKNLVLKMVKPKNLQPNFKIAWSLLLKNIYPLGVRDIKQEGFEFDIKREIDGQDPTSENGSIRYLSAFGLDKYTAGGSEEVPDKIFDFIKDKRIITETGEIIFPVLEPFGDDLPAGLPATFKYDDVYDTAKTAASNIKEKDKWLLVGKSKGSSQSSYSLGFNVVENSVKVRLNGRELVAGSDYIVDYNVGQLTIRNDAALVPGADLKITYEQNDLFQLASKTLLGARGIYDFSKKTKLGFSALTLSEQTLSDKVRIGEEPLSNSILGMDFTTSADLPIVTKFIDNLFSTREMSTFNFSGEVAYMMPDPNTKKSTIPADGGKSIAYIDDFEGAKKTIPVGIGYTSWKDISPPEDLAFLNIDTAKARMPYKGKAFWFSDPSGSTTIKNIYGNKKSVANESEQVSVLDFVFLPDKPGMYNRNSNLSDPKKSWGGVQKVLSSTSSNLIEQNIEYFEFWAQIIDAPKDAKLYVDLGFISEDIIPNDTLNTEDIDGNDAIDVEGKEDTGLDGLFDPQEREHYGSDKSDPNGDNFVLVQQSTSLLSYYNINGTEGNAILSDAGRVPDTEDLNRSGFLEKNNDYFRYEIPLDTNRLTNHFINGGGFTSDNWYLYRIPLKDSSHVVGSPSFSNVESIRFFMHGVDSMVHIRLYEFNFVGNQWIKNLPANIIKSDTVLSISVVSLEENDNYTSPGGVFQERDRTRPDQQIYANEQSLSLIFNGLKEGDKREAVKNLPRQLDVFNYKQMKLFIHGDNADTLHSISYGDSLGQYSAEVYYRFGSDTNNYYEYRQPVLKGWNEVTIDFERLTAIKQSRPNDSTIYKEPVEGRNGHYYVIKGNPTLTAVKFLMVGVVNLDNNFNNGPLFGEVWVNELRVIGADDRKGLAYSFSSSLKLADFATVSFNMSHTDPYFHRLSDQFGSRVDQQNWAISTDINLLKLIPFNMPESNLRLNYSHTQSLGKPLYIPGSDVLIESALKAQRELYINDTTGLIKSPEQLQEETETESISDSWSAANIKFKVPTKLWYIRDSFNAITIGFNYNKSFSRNPTTKSNRNWIWNANLNYGLSLSPDYYFSPIDIPVIGLFFSLFKDYSGTKIYFTPQNFTLALTARRNSNTNITRARKNTPSSQISSYDFVTSRSFNFSWKITDGGFFNVTTSYGLNISSSLAYLETNNVNGVLVPRTESEIWSDIFSGAGFGKDNRYQQNYEIRTAPKLPSLFDINKFFTLTASYAVSYQWQNDFSQPQLGRSAGNSNRSQVGLTTRWKSLFEPLFKVDVVKTESPNNVNNLKNRQIGIEPKSTDLDSLMNPLSVKDSVKMLDSLVLGVKKPALVTRALGFLVAAVKYVFIDYEMISFNFSNDNSLSKSGLQATGTGFYNFWGLFYDVNAGPTRGFMLGINGDAGPRVALANTKLSDVFTQKNSIDFKTSRPLWEGAKIDITWKSGWSLNKNSSLTTSTDGSLYVSNIAETGNINRSFLSIPPVLFFSVFNTGIKQVNELYSSDPNKDLSSAFVKGFETFPFFAKIGFLEKYANYIPRANWRITWDGLEKLPLLKSLANRISLDHSYSSTYTEGWLLNPDGVQQIQVQRIEYGFAPLMGLNLTFGQVWGGNLSGNLKYSTRTSFDLGLSTKNITENFSKDIGFTLQFSKSGFELPLFGVALKNDIEFSFAYSSSRSASIKYEMQAFKEEGTPQDGTKRVTIEPRIKYTISAKVTLSIFYKRTTIEPEGASRIPPTTTNEAGLDVNITIN